MGHTHTHTHTHQHTHTCTHAHTYTRTHMHTRTRAHTHVHMCIHIHAHAHTHVHTYTRTHIHIHARARPHTHWDPRQSSRRAAVGGSSSNEGNMGTEGGLFERKSLGVSRGEGGPHRQFLCQPGWAQGHGPVGTRQRAGVGRARPLRSSEQDASGGPGGGVSGARGPRDRFGERVLPEGFAFPSPKNELISERAGMWKQIPAPTRGGAPKGPPRSLGGFQGPSSWSTRPSWALPTPVLTPV